MEEPLHPLLFLHLQANVNDRRSNSFLTQVVIPSTREGSQGTSPFARPAKNALRDR